MAGATHGPNVSVTVTLSPAARQEAGFGNVLLLVPKATNSLNSARVMTFESYEDAQTARTAGYIAAATLEAARVAFSQRPKPRKFKVANVDLAAGTPETYSDGLTAAIAADGDFYVICLDSRVAATITALGATIEASSKRMILVAQNASTSWLDSGLPSDITGSRERTVYIFHDTDAQWNDVAWACACAVFNPDDRSAPWHGRALNEVDALATSITAAQRTILIETNYGNVGLPYGGEDFVMDPGWNSNGRPIYEIISADWFATRLEERVAAEVVEHSGRGEKIPVSTVGQAKILAIIRGLYAQGVAGGHFITPDEDDEPIVAETITDDDRSDATLRFTVRAQIAVAARLFTFDCYFSTDALSA